jgi:hypothetical protein
MREPTDREKQQYTRIRELFALSKQRYLSAGGDPRKCPTGREGDDYLIEEERQEIQRLSRSVFGIRVVGDEVHCQGRTWKLSRRPIDNHY